MSNETVETVKTVEVPKITDRKAAWVAYAVAKGEGVTTEAANALTKSELIAQYGQPNGQESGEGTATRKAPDTSYITEDAINAAVLATGEMRKAGAPVRERKPEQLLMDAVAARAYAQWIADGRPSDWDDLPVVTYYLEPDQVADWRYLIRKACAIIPPEGDSKGVRARFGNPFTLSEKMAEKFGMPENAGKVVLMWAAIDKRASDNKDATAAQTTGE